MIGSAQPQWTQTTTAQEGGTILSGKLTRPGRQHIRPEVKAAWTIEAKF